MAPIVTSLASIVKQFGIGAVLAASTGTAKASGGSNSFFGGKTIHTFMSSGTFTTPGTFNETVEYVVVGGGGGAGGSNGSGYTGGGGAGAGNYKTNTTPISGPFSAAVTIGAGGNRGEGTFVAPVTVGSAGGTTTLAFPSPISAPGGAGGGHGASPGPSNTSGSGGGAGYPNLIGGSTTGSSFPGTIGTTPASGWAHAGGNAFNPNGGSGGGGGAGGTGGTGTGGTGYGGGPGGAGIQLPSTFRNPTSTVGAPGPTSAPTPNGYDISGKYWIAGGGGAGFLSDFPGSRGFGGGAGGPYAGAGDGSPNNSISAPSALQNTGSGGGGGTRNTNPPDSGSPGGSGGSGIVIIAYPS
jgi:hypothetical protein